MYVYYYHGTWEHTTHVINNELLVILHLNYLTAKGIKQKQAIME